MRFDDDNKILALCAQGMMLEGEGKNEEASRLFMQAWEEAENDFEKFTAAHYVARHQPAVADKLQWDMTALEYARRVDSDVVSATYPSLYLNIAKCYEDMNDRENAKSNYKLANSFVHLLPDDGYGNMIRNGVAQGMARVS